MNYLHDFHAGNFCEVFKHVVLYLLLDALIKKDKPFFYLDTHAGSALYDLHGAQAQKTLEYKNGIAKLWKQASLPHLLQQYLSIIKHYNPDSVLRFYPGSPCIAHHLLRPADRMVLIDHHPLVYQHLAKRYARDKQVVVKEQDGYQACKAFLPPPERRGLVFIDPPYEDHQEFSSLTEQLTQAYQRWPTGIYAVWYPIKNRSQINYFYQQLIKTSITKLLATEFCLAPDDVPQRLNGSGMLIINPPWQVDQQLQEALPLLLNYLRQAYPGKTQVEFLKTQ